MAEVDEPILLEKRLEQLVFSGQYDDTAWALFWASASDQNKGFVVLVSRLRAASSKE